MANNMNPHDKQQLDPSRLGDNLDNGEELEALDKKAIEKQYVESYNFTRSQRITAIIAVFVIALGVIAAIGFLIMSIFPNLVK